MRELLIQILIISIYQPVIIIGVARSGTNILRDVLTQLFSTVHFFSANIEKCHMVPLAVNRPRQGHKQESRNAYKISLTP